MRRAMIVGMDRDDCRSEKDRQAIAGVHPLKIKSQAPLIV